MRISKINTQYNSNLNFKTPLKPVKNEGNQVSQPIKTTELPLGFNTLYNVSFSSKYNPNRLVGDVDLETYYTMTERTKERYRRAYKSFSKNEAIDKEELIDPKDPHIPMQSDELLDEFIKTSSIYLKYKDQPIICLGRSPKWFLNTAFWMKDGLPEYKFVAFSGYWYQQNSKDGAKRMDKQAPTLEEELAYRNYLKKIGVTPRRIVDTMKKEGKKTVITDYVCSGKGFCSFLDIMSRFAKDEGLLEEFSKSIQIVSIGSIEYMEELNPYADDIPTPTVPMPELLEPYANNIKQEFHDMDYRVHREILMNRNTNECRSTYYPHRVWTIFEPYVLKVGMGTSLEEIFKLLRELEGNRYEANFKPAMGDFRNLLNFRILDYLHSKDMLRDCKSLENNYSCFRN